MANAANGQPTLAAPFGSCFHSQKGLKHRQLLMRILSLAVAIGTKPQPFGLIGRCVSQAGSFFIGGRRFAMNLGFS